MKRKAYRLSQEGKEQRVALLQSILRSKEEIVFAYVYGSFIEGEAFHDIDVGIFLSEIPPENYLPYGLSLSQLLSSKLQIPVDVRILNLAPASFRYHVIRGKLIFERDEEVSAQVIEKTVQRYLDLKPFIYRGIKEAYGR
jgi:predicted nucleotidyltransferase